MPFVAVTRLRIRSPRFLPAFAVHAMQSLRRAKRAPGFLGGSLLTDRRWTFWTMTSWEGAGDMRRFMIAGAHAAAMPRLLEWCDEAAVVHWSQPDRRLPAWIEAAERMRQDGRPSKVRNPSPGHAALSYPAPRVSGARPIRPVPPR